MTQFEYVTVAVSMILALTFARLLSGLPHVLAPGRRYWIHALWCLLMVPTPLGFWWAIWTYHEVDPWTFRAFASVMLTPALMYLSVVSLVSDNPSGVQCWRSHFFARRRLVFALFLASMLSIYLRQLAVLGDAGAPVMGNEVQFLSGALLVVPLAGFFTAREPVHAILCIGAAGLSLLNYGRLLLAG